MKKYHIIYDIYKDNIFIKQDFIIIETNNIPVIGQCEITDNIKKIIVSVILDD